MIIDPQVFAIRMAEHWTQNLNNISSPKLEANWQQMAEVFNQQITGNQKGLTVLQPPTGSGKTKGLELYCALLAREGEHPGILIVTKLRDEAEKIADNINMLASMPFYAVAYHSENSDQIDYDFAHGARVLVITHAAYLIWAKCDQPPLSHHTWQHGRRKLIVIDEAIDLIDVQTVDMDKVIQSVTQIPQNIREKWPEEQALLGRIMAKMQSIRAENTSGTRWVEAAEWQVENPYATQLKREIGRLSLDENWLGHSDLAENFRLQHELRENLNGALDITKTWSLFARKGDTSVFTTAKVAVPPHKLNAVILDATASCNPIYELLGDYVHLQKPIEGIRNYSNVSVYASINHKVGKTALCAFDDAEIRNALDSLAVHLKKDDRLFICTHKRLKPHLGGFDGLPEGYQIGHWGAVDGRNDWHDCTTAFIYGLPYLDNIAPEVILRAVEEWLGWRCPDSLRQNHIQSICEGHIITRVVQAINRIQCRHVIDGDGNCSATNIFLLLPAKQQAERIVKGIVEQMFGIKIMPWQSKAAKRKVKRGKHEHTLLNFFEAASPGKYSTLDLKARFGIADTTFDRLIQKVKDTTSDFCQRLVAIGVHYVSFGTGRGHQARFEKIG